MLKMKKTYYIMELDDKGMLNHPKGIWDSDRFHTWGYDSLEDVEEALVKSGLGKEYVLITKVRMVEEDDE